MPVAEPHIAPEDTARIESGHVYDLDMEDPESGLVTRQRHIEVEIQGRPRLFAVTVDRGTGAVHSGIVHRGGF
jgi:hypothetical protein